jgi:hypothetical protein
MFKNDHELRNGLCAGLLCCGIVYHVLKTSVLKKSFQLCHLLDVPSAINVRFRGCSSGNEAR